MTNARYLLSNLSKIHICLLLTVIILIMIVTKKKTEDVNWVLRKHVMFEISVSSTSVVSIICSISQCNKKSDFNNCTESVLRSSFG